MTIIQVSLVNQVNISEDKKLAKRSKKFAVVSNSVGTFGNKLKKAGPEITEAKKKKKNKSRPKYIAPRIDLKTGGNRIDKNLRRLKAFGFTLITN